MSDSATGNLGFSATAHPVSSTPMGQGLASTSSRSMHRVSGLNGIEFFSEDNATFDLVWFNREYSIGAPTTWKGEILYRRRRESVGRGMALCTVPGETHQLTRTRVSGSYRVIMFDPDVFTEYLEEHGIRHGHFDWRSDVNSFSAELSRTFWKIQSVACEPTASPLELQSWIVRLVGDLASEWIRPRSRRPVAHPGIELAERIRERLHSGESAGLDLETLAREYGVSRYQALRTFKERFGLPPHQYLTCVKVNYARELLRRGHTAAEVAATLNFSDQSHLGRHFRRLLGMTPSTYAARCRPRATL